mmetsp:Transcript_34798/g.55880  ORF Transcript_34798/g.55880 Transcript_34798/m.55880 type:complete len:436 (-) Transcript_34798:38-1345(-)
MIAAHARRALAAKRSLIINDVLHGGIHTRTPARDLREHLLNVCAALGVHIHGQWRLLAVHDFDRIVQSLVWHNGHDGPEDLLLHEGRVHGGIVDDGGRDVPRAPVDAGHAAADELALGGLDEPLHSVDVALVHDLAVLPVGLGVVAVAGLHQGLLPLHELLCPGLVHQHVVGRDADLPAIHPLDHRHAVAGGIHLGGLVDDDRRLAAQLKGYRREMFRGGPHNDLAHDSVACVEDVVPSLLQQGRGLVKCSLDDLDALGIQVLLHQGLQQRRARGAHLAGLDDDTIACGDRRNQRHEREVEGEVPRRDDQHHAFGLGSGVALVDPAANPLVVGPVVQVSQCKVRGRARADLAKAPEPAAAEVLASGLRDSLVVLTHHPVDALKLPSTPGYVLRFACVECCPHLAHHRLIFRTELLDGRHAVRVEIQISTKVSNLL